MKRKGFIKWMLVLGTGLLVSCASDSEMPSDKEILSDALTKGSWQVGFQHLPSQNDFDHSHVQLTFLEAGKVKAFSLKSTTSHLSMPNGAYSLFYGDDHSLAMDVDEPDYDELDRNRDKDEPLFLSIAFGIRELVILNGRWEVKSFSSTSVKLQASELAMTLNKTVTE